MRAAIEYRALIAAMTDTSPVCAGDARYVTDKPDLDDAELAEMGAGCDLCPLRRLCETYAAKAHPEGGFWAGRYWASKRREEPWTN